MEENIGDIFCKMNLLTLDLIRFVVSLCYSIPPVAPFRFEEDEHRLNGPRYFASRNEMAENSINLIRTTIEVVSADRTTTWE